MLLRLDGKTFGNAHFPASETPQFRCSTEWSVAPEGVRPLGGRLRAVHRYAPDKRRVLRSLAARAPADGGLSGLERGLDGRLHAAILSRHFACLGRDPHSAATVRPQ
eukprot:11966061-Alexandrium_andersonii.AAC.1